MFNINILYSPNKTHIYQFVYSEIIPKSLLCGNIIYGIFLRISINCFPFSLKVIDSELEPTDEEKELLQFVEVTTRELEKTDYEETRDEQAENEEIEPKDGNSQFQTEVEMLRNENKRLKEENDELWTTISILDNDNPRINLYMKMTQLLTLDLKARL